MRKLNIKDNKLLWGGKYVAELAEKYETPLFVYNESIIEKSIKELEKGPWEIHYAIKANPSPEILKILLKHNVGIDAVSANEVKYTREFGFDTKKIVYTSSSLSEKEVREVVDMGVLVNLNSIEEIDVYGRVAPGTNIGIRINPEVKAGHHRIVQTATDISKFGILINNVEEALKKAEKYDLKVTMAHFHIGSGILDAKLFIEAFENVLGILSDLNFRDLTHINLGGGIGTPYRPNEERLNLKYLIEEVNKLKSEFEDEQKKKYQLVIEPGRYLVNESGLMVVNVNTISKNDHRTFYRVDSGFNHLLRPAMYGAYHHFVNASCVENGKEEVVLSGNICESGDVFNDEPREVCKAKINDKIAILDVGAYGISMGMETYNLRGLPAEVMITKEGEEKLFAQHQSLKDIISRYEK